ncbi:MAG: hypothetical protein HKN57_03300 [Xanthomonadales bacterium]|nr:hypothetical protein [Gammaproteobacteria bacterium]NND56254.1 hypothetical protein [Xanthomonadales bacterium]NNK52329.1 hypothetical protein [Xanthomonadales bacterium]
MKAIQCMIMILLGVLAIPAAGAASADPLFQSQGTLKVEITAPLSTLVRERSESEDLPGVFSFRDADGTTVDLDVQVRARGRFRHKHCDFPPVTLNFRRSQVEGTLFDQQNKLKMVPHCKITRRYEQSVVREYLAYRLLNLMTDLSFRVRLLEVTWVDSDERRGRMVRSAFLIEHKNRLADRIGREEQEIEQAEVSAIEPKHLNLTSMFQYLIGNFDFSPIAGSRGECCHNYEMFGYDVDSLVAIPYDFDFSGLVNAPNAIPDTDVGVERVGQRVYLGYCANNGLVKDSIADFQESRGALYALVADQTELEPNVRQNIAAYMDEFYEIINIPGAVEQKITGKCQ